jgi:3-hydroxymyristoyl/3-hydroxydecanoyl-(acyl carrier protein) dehydratase
MGTSPFREVVPMGRESYREEQLDALRTGDLGKAFGPLFEGRQLAQALQLPGGAMRLIHRVNELDLSGGSYGLGRIEAEADVDPQGWYLTCHFVDDMVMPGTLMYEGCLHALRIYLLRLGWVVEEQGSDLHYAPIPGEASALRCRGQVLQTSRLIRYRIDIKELGYDPEPYVLADAVMFVDGKKAVRFGNVSYRLHGLDEEVIREGWRTTRSGGTTATLSTSDGVAQAPASPTLPPGGRFYGPEEILAYATGKPSEGFGPEY